MTLIPHLHQWTDHPDRKFNKATVVLNDTIDWLDFIYTYRTLHTKTPEYKSFSSGHGRFFRIDHMLGHKTNFNKFKRIEIISNTFSNHNSMKLEINYGKKNGKRTNTRQLNNMLLKKPVGQWRNQRENQKIPWDKCGNRKKYSKITWW